MKSLICDYCGESFKAVDLLGEHLEFSCPDGCGCEFDSETCMEKHAPDCAFSERT